MSSKRCCVPKCATGEGSPEALHSFPNPAKEMERFRSWIYAIGGEILGFSNEYIYKQRRVCHVHFEKKYCCRNNRISNIAVPTLYVSGAVFLPALTNEKPLTEIQNLPSTSEGLLSETMFIADTEIAQHTKFLESTSHPTRLKDPTVAVPDLLHNVTPHTLELNVHDKKVKNKKVSYRFKHQIRTPTERYLCKILMKMRVKLSKYRNKIRKQSAKIKAVKKVISNPELLKALDDFPSGGKLLTLMELRENKKKKAKVEGSQMMTKS